MARVLIFSDSLPLPRDYPERCEYEHCWPQKLATSHTVHQVSIGGATITEICSQIPYTKMFRPDVVLLQSGIVDCSPRALKKSEISFLQKIPFFGHRILNFLQKKRVKLRKWRKIRYTKPTQFSEALNLLTTQFPDVPVYAISIVRPDDSYETDVPGILASIDLYNNLLQQKFQDNYINIADMPENGIMSDHHHLNQHGHLFVFQRITNLLETRFPNT